MEFRHKQWQLGARASNIGDSTVEDFNGFPKPGRSFFFSIERTL
jgi:outer membrane cobalamin receptor